MSSPRIVTMANQILMVNVTENVSVFLKKRHVLMSETREEDQSELFIFSVSKVI